MVRQPTASSTTPELPPSEGPAGSIGGIGFGGVGLVGAVGAVGVVAGVLVWLALRSIAASGDVGPIGGILVVALTAAVAATAAAASVANRSSADRARLGAELERVRQAIATDGLTGLTARSGITDDLDRRLAARRPGELVGVLFCDLDRLDLINDALGHEAGDEVLAVTARRLSGVVRAGDSLGRFGEGKFVAVSAGLPAVRDLEILAGRLLDALRLPIVLADGSAQVVSASIGITWLSGDREATAGELLRDAARALDRARRGGGDRWVVFNDSQRAEAVARLELEQELWAGIRDDRIEVYYQPIVDARSGTVDRVEALIRWSHPRRGTVLPSEFLPVAAESRLIVELGRLVLVEACRQAVEWSARLGRPISVAVNVAERQLLDTGLVETVTRVLATTGLPPQRLELEVTEDLILDRFDQALVVLRQLDLLGVRLAIDDFGTSQASLGRLRELATVSTLKIDRLFVAGLAGDETVPSGSGSAGVAGGGSVDREIVAAIVTLANSVGMSVVAEGVETAAQARILRDLGVDHFQGFLFGRPGPAATLEAAFQDDLRDRWSL